MECTRLKNWHFCWNRKNRFSILGLDSGYTGNRYPLWVSISVKLKKKKEKKKVASYQRHGSTALPENMNYNNQCQNEPNKQHFVWGNSSELKSENRKGEVYYGLHVTTPFTHNNEKNVCLRSHIWIQSWWYRLPLIYIWQLELIRTSIK